MSDDKKEIQVDEIDIPRFMRFLSSEDLHRIANQIKSGEQSTDLLSLDLNKREMTEAIESLTGLLSIDKILKPFPVYIQNAIKDEANIPPSNETGLGSTRLPVVDLDAPQGILYAEYNRLTARAQGADEGDPHPDLDKNNPGEDSQENDPPSYIP